MSQPLILAARRTPTGKFQGSLARIPAPQLGAFAIAAALADVPGSLAKIDECIMGCVLQAGVGQNPARQAGLRAGLPSSLSAVTVNKVCGSGLHAVMMAAQSIRAGDNHVVVAGGMENMDLAPHLASVRSGVRYGKFEALDHMEYDGLRCAFEGWGMGLAAEHIATSHGISRTEQDRFSAQSHVRAAHATTQGWFRNEIVALTAEQIKQKTGLDMDEGFRAESTAETLAKLKPAFKPDGTVTAANASQISDGAAAVIVASEAAAKSLNAKALARILGSNTVGVEPKELFFAPALGIEKSSRIIRFLWMTSISSRSTKRCSASSLQYKTLENQRRKGQCWRRRNCDGTSHRCKRRARSGHTCSPPHPNQWTQRNLQSVLGRWKRGDNVDRTSLKKIALGAEKSLA